jgi:biopolymer transport protein ExbB
MFWMRSLGISLFYFASLSLPLFGLDTVASQTNSQEAYFDLIQVFQSCPLIYSLLILMSILAVSIWLYSMFTLRTSLVIPKTLLDNLNTLFNERKYDEALDICQKKETYTASILAAGIAARKYGPQMIIESMTSEGKRIALILWQRISLLNEIAVIAPMVGLLGTVVGLFLAFYDSNRNAESMASLFDGLGIAIGTTVVGLIVSILAMILYTTLKFRVVNLLNTIESETLAFTPKLEME